MRKQFIIGLLTVVIAVAGCSGSDNSYNGNSNFYSIGKDYSDSISSNGIASDSYGSGQKSTEDAASQEEQVARSQTDQTIDREMLIYSCDVKIDTLDYKKSVNAFKAGLKEMGLTKYLVEQVLLSDEKRLEELKEMGGFVEHEYYSDGAGFYGYYVEESEKTKNYTATVRIPSQKYESFVTSLGDLGDVRSQNADVENVSQEYKDAGIQLKILEAKEAAYLKMLKKAENTNEILTIQNTLTEIQVQIEQLKSRIQTIETDVAYSFINIEISEVARYQDEPKETDTFFQRLSNTVTETAEDFLDFLEWLLFTVIRLFPYVIVFIVVLPIIFRIRKRYRKKHPKTPKLRTATQMQKIHQEQDGRKTYIAPDYSKEQSNHDSNSSDD